MVGWYGVGWGRGGSIGEVGEVWQGRYGQDRIPQFELHRTVGEQTKSDKHGLVRILALSHYFKGKSTKYSHYSHGQSERAAHNLPNSYAIIWCKLHCAVLNCLGFVAPCRSIRDGNAPVTHTDLHRTGRSYCAPYYKIAESTESAERRRKARKRRKAQKGLFWAIRAKKIGANRGGSTGG